MKGSGDACSVLSLRSQPPRPSVMQRAAPPVASSTTLPRPARVPDWIRSIFRLAKKGDLEAMTHSLRDMERELVWNLSDSQGNSLWHVCAARNHLRCFQWLCQGHPQHVLTDENHSSLTPVGTAAKHGSLEIIQWLVSKSCALEQINPPEGNRTLLHLAAKYGQERVVRWLAEYTLNNQLNINRKDSDGNTAVHLAAKYGHISVIKTLVLFNADVTAQNEQDLRPYSLSVQSGRTACADYLLTVEVCLCLSSEQVLLEGNFQSLQVENAEMKNGFKELLMLTKRLLRRQEEMLQYVQAVCSGNMNSDKAESDSAQAVSWNFPSGSMEGSQTQAKLQALLEKTQLKLLPEEESRLLQLEEKWRRLRSSKCAVETRSPLELIRSHFSHALAKCSSPHVQQEARPASSSDTSVSDSSGEESAEENVTQKQESANQLWGRVPPPWEQEVHSWDKVQVFLDGLSNNRTPTKKARNSTNTLVIRHGGAAKQPVKDHRKPRPAAPTRENVSLKVLFENNPELRQEGQTCSVLEVLEPSSSDAEEDLVTGLRRESGGSSSSSFHSNENTVLHVAERRPRQRSTLERDVAAKDAGRGHAILLTNIAELPDCSSRYKVSFKIQQSQERPHDSGQEPVVGKEEVVTEKKTRNVAERQMIYTEPDLIRGMSATERCSAELPSIPDCPPEPPFRDSFPQETALSTAIADEVEERRAGEAMSLPEGGAVGDSSPSVSGNAKKRSGFLLKFSLRGRWPSKQKQQRKSEEISPEEFRETYTRNMGATEVSVRDMPEQPIAVKTGDLFPVPPPPTRKGPPPVPPCEEELPLASPAPSVEEEKISHHEEDQGLLFLHSASPEPSLLQPDSVLSKTTGGSMSRPASSASQTEDGRRGAGNEGVGFSLPKMLSPTELLLHTPESSVAGRQSPAPSEVSKTESALSPPSDVSKTESARQPHLGKIEEIVGARVQPTCSSTVSQAPLESQELVVIQQDAQPHQGKAKKMTLAARKNKKSSKPWYEVSDEEDMLSPDKYQTARARSSSEDETDLAIVA